MALINTTRGELDESTLRKEIYKTDKPDMIITQVAYFLGEELVRQDIDVFVKEGFQPKAVANL